MQKCIFFAKKSCKTQYVNFFRCKNSKTTKNSQKNNGLLKFKNNFFKGCILIMRNIFDIIYKLKYILWGVL